MNSKLGQPIPFIEIEDDNDERKHNFIINPYAIAILQEMKDRKVSTKFFILKYQVGVLVIAGPQRSGKSYLANRIVDKYFNTHPPHTIE